MAILHRKLLSAANSTSLYTCSLIDDCEDSYLFGYCLRCVYISPPPPPPPVRQKSSFLPYLISAVCALGVAFLILSTCTILLRYRFSRRRNPSSNSNLEEETVFVDEDHGPIIDHPIWHIVSVGLPQSVIDSIPTFKYKRGDGLLSEGSDCSVCLTEFEEDDHLRLLPKCSHAFHLPCIDTWLNSHKNCPLCRSTVENVSNLTPILGETSQRRDEFDNLPIEGIRIAEILKRNRENRVLSCDLGENSRMMNEPVRRSISLDASAALAITNGVDHHVDTVAGEGTSSKQEKRIKGVRRESSMSRLIKSSSIGRSLQKAPVSMKRSLSSSAKIFSSFRGSKSQSCEMPYSGLKVGASF